jgi:hypothetical protein
MGGTLLISLMAYTFMAAAESALWNIMSVYAVVGALFEFTASQTFVRLSIKYDNSSCGKISNISTNEIIKTAKIVCVITGTIGTLIAVVALIIISKNLINQIDHTKYNSVLLSIIMYFSGQWIYYSLIMPHVIYLSINDNVKKANYIISSSNILKIFGCLISFISRDNLALLALSHLISMICMLLLFVNISGLPKERGYPSANVCYTLFKDGWGPTWRNGALGASQFIISNIMMLTLPSVGSAKTIAGFALAHKGVISITALYSMILQAHMPTISAFRFKDEIDVIKNTYLPRIGKGLILSIIASFIGYIVYILFTKYIAKSVQPISFFVYILITLIIVLEAHSTLHRQIYITKNEMPFFKGLIATSFFVGFIPGIVLVKYGLIASCMSQLIISCLYSYWYPVLYNIKDLNSDMFEYIRISIKLK